MGDEESDLASGGASATGVYPKDNQRSLKEVRLVGRRGVGELRSNQRAFIDRFAPKEREIPAQGKPRFVAQPWVEVF